MKPQNTKEVGEIIGQALAGGEKLEVIGGGTRAGIGAPREVPRLCLAGLSGILEYDPAELVLTARAGTPLAEIEAAVAERGQGLAFEPYGAAGSTIGGVLAAGVAGARRVSAGGARDHLLGFEAVSGRGEIFRAGAKVVKNVTGYDLPKLLCGSWGRLAALTEVTLKVLPRAPERVTLCWRGLADEPAFALMRAALRAPCDVAAAAHLPGEATMLRLDGVGPSIAARRDYLGAALAAYGPPEALDDAAPLWARVQGGAGLTTEAPLWRLSLPPRAALGAIAPLLAAGGAWLADWAGGLIWLAPEGHEALIREAADAAGGHATLMRAPAEIRARIPALHPQAPGVEALSRRVRRGFDPMGIFETNRFLDEADAD
ncbi:FAD-binding protein [Acidocella sp. MX-AZ02]|uniref:FAD-binding protein n=1 Tax=Acidocella sp. MX-AZ02 TaxID=1214225 RepID=UPI00028D41D2|nr:FAD-binding protein [Acidocella sp. MX-AZ02]EKM99493.1 FAD linked oxidase domain-containing protein [Acidocella sp. MX-AZ02]